MTMELSVTTLITAFIAGGISFLSPCILPLVPGYLAYVAGTPIAADVRPRPALSRAFLFVAGFSTVFIALGASASLLGQWLLAYKYEATLLGGAITVLFGLFTTGLVRLGAFERDVRYHGRISGGPASSYVLGLAFGFGWTPCIGPVLASILMITAVTASAHGLLLLASYSAGLGVPFILVALCAETGAMSTRRWRHFGRVLQVFAGVTMIVAGLAMMTGNLTAAALWLLETFPALARLG